MGPCPIRRPEDTGKYDPYGKCYVKGGQAATDDPFGRVRAAAHSHEMPESAPITVLAWAIESRILLLASAIERRSVIET